MYHNKQKLFRNSSYHRQFAFQKHLMNSFSYIFASVVIIFAWLTILIINDENSCLEVNTSVFFPNFCYKYILSLKTEFYVFSYKTKILCWYSPVSMSYLNQWNLLLFVIATSALYEKLCPIAYVYYHNCNDDIVRNICTTSRA